MCPQNISDRPGAVPSITPIDIAPPGRDLLHRDVEPSTPHVFGDRVGNRTLASGARHERWIDRINRDKLAQQRNAGIAHRASIMLTRPAIARATSDVGGGGHAFQSCIMRE